MICSSLNPKAHLNAFTTKLQPFVNKTFATFPFILLTMQQLKNPKIDKFFFKFVRMKQIKT